MVNTPPRLVRSARPEVTRALMAETGLDDAVLGTLLDRFYARARADDLLGPVFERVEHWPEHMVKVGDFWSSVALGTGRYSGAPVPAHLDLPIGCEHFERWLALFGEAAAEVCRPEGAAHLVAKAERIAGALRMAVDDHQRGGAHPPPLR